MPKRQNPKKKKVIHNIMKKFHHYSHLCFCFDEKYFFLGRLNIKIAVKYYLYQKINGIIIRKFCISNSFC